LVSFRLSGGRTLTFFKENLRVSSSEGGRDLSSAASEFGSQAWPQKSRFISANHRWRRFAASASKDGGFVFGGMMWHT
jgi:hypothetical protein